MIGIAGVSMFLWEYQITLQAGVFGKKGSFCGGKVVIVVSKEVLELRKEVLVEAKDTLELRKEMLEMKKEVLVIGGEELLVVKKDVSDGGE